MPATEEVLTMTPRCPSASAGSVLHRRLVGHVGAGELAADLVRDLLAAAFVQVGDDHRDARRREHPRGRLAEAARAAGNDRRSTVELHAGSIPAAPSGPPGPRCSTGRIARPR
jgi:hypothetical protein